MFSAMSLSRKAKEHLERAVELDPNFLDARMALLQYYLEAPSILGGDQGKALAQANEIKKRDAQMGHRAFAAIYEAKKNPDLARKEAIDSVKEQPSSPKSHYWLGVHILRADKNYKAAADEFETSIKLDPAYMPAWFQIGHMAALGGASLSRGEEGLQKYLAYTPKPGEPAISRAHYWLGMIFEKQGKKAEARERYNASLRLNPSQKDVAEALKRVS
jgi:tetratricopeptide (TPR) repeat protein